ncbi:MAG: 1-acyl-sn-glycerol-3-phosphate acyltransferase, partial [Candidatus Acidiferrales bacterium]
MSGWFYRFGRALLNQSVSLYYRRIELAAAERIPEKGPAIIVANHPNSVADAFLVAARLTPRRINFIAKDTITGAPVVGWLARQFGVVGVARAYEYERQRDMARKRTEAAIGSCIPRLLAGELVVIFGEGISTDVRRLHMIRKGALRFGYAAERAAGFQLGLQWIPVGINYSAKQRFRSDVVLRVGEPFG